MNKYHNYDEQNIIDETKNKVENINKDNCLKILKKSKKRKKELLLYQFILLIFIIGLWQALADFELIDTFLFSSPRRIVDLLIKYIGSNEIYKHIGISVLEVILGLFIGSFFGILIAIILWLFDSLAKICDPFLMVLNALPKTALAPIMIIWAGTGVKGIVVVALSILIIITIISAYNYFINVDKEKIKMMKSFQATKLQILFKLILPINFGNIITILKINIGMSWIGVIVGEFLVSKAGIGYLIMYGGQVFNMDLVMMGVLVLAILAFTMWKAIDIIEKHCFKK